MATLISSSTVSIYSSDKDTVRLSFTQIQNGILNLYLTNQQSFDLTNLTLARIGNDLSGSLLDSIGNKSNFYIQNEYTSSSPISTINIFTSSSSPYITSGILSPSSSGNLFYAGSTSSTIFNVNGLSGLNSTFIFGNGQNDKINTISGVQFTVYEPPNTLSTVYYPNSLLTYSVTPTVVNNSISKISITSKTATPSSTTTDTLNNVQRVEFLNLGIAYDITGNAGTAAKFVGILYGGSAVTNGTYQNYTYASIALGLIDSGRSQDSIMQFGLNTVLGFGFTNSDEVQLLFKNLLNSTPSASDLSYWSNSIDSGQFTQSSLAIMAANTSLNTTNINLTGLQTKGLFYIPPQAAMF
jgi:hypothetical protein